MPHRCMYVRTFIALVVFIALLQPSDIFALRLVESVVATPSLLFIKEKAREVIVRASIPPDPDLIIQKVRLWRLDENGAPQKPAQRFLDNGKQGDEFSGDGIFTRRLKLKAAKPKEMRFRVCAEYQNPSERLCSSIIEIRFTEKPFFTPPEPGKIVEENGAFYPINHIIIALPQGFGRDVAEAIAAEVGAKIVGFAPSSNSYTLEVTTETVVDLNTLIIQLESDPRIDLVVKNYILGLDGDNDLSNLRSRDPSLTATFDHIKVQNAWDLIIDRNPPLYSVTIGIIDTGVDITHDEFIGVNFGGTPLSVFTPTSPHGTSVAGIIGATNISAISNLPADSPQMNGIIAGIPSPNISGSKVNYTLEVRGTPVVLPNLLAVITGFQFIAQVDELAAAGVQVVNMSFGLHPESKTSVNAVPDFDFLLLKALFRRAIERHPNMIFVASAGNADIDAVDHIPGGGLELPNIITVAATNLDDERSSFSNFGNGVSIAAPGENVYAPILFSPPLDDGDYASPLNGNSPYSGCTEGYFCGTSAAAPMVTGTVALMLALKPTLTPPQIAAILRNTGDPIVTDKNIGGRRLNALRAVNFITKPVDVFILVDLSGSFGNDLAVFKSQAADIVETLVEKGLNVHFGLGRFEDYPISPFGSAGFGDVAYARVTDIKPPEDLDDDGTIDILEDIAALTTRSGDDLPQSQLPALFQVATGQGQDVPPGGPSTGDIPAGQQANFRTGSLPIVVLWTDAIFHQPGDPGSIPYPGPSVGDVCTALNGKGIKVIGIAGVPGFGDVVGDLSTIAACTSTLAPQGGVDCNNDGITDVPEGDPLVCPISSTGQGIGEAIVSTVLAIAE